jgi:hypothetical protein
MLGVETLEERRLLTSAPTTGSIAAILDAEGTQMDIFAIGTDNQVYAQTSMSSTGGWYAWHLTQPGAVKEIAVAHDGTGTLNVFAIRMDNQVWDEKLLPNGDWSGWTLTRPGYAQDVATQPTVIPGKTIQVFIIGADNQVWSESLKGGGGWTSWTLTHPGYAKQISVMMDDTGDTHVFAIGMDNQVWSERSLVNGGWSSWTLTQPGTVQAITTPTVTVSQGALKVFAIGEDGQVYVESNANGWKGWNLTRSGVATAISAINDSSGTSNVFAVGLNQHVYFETASSPWSVWKSTGASGTFLGGDVTITPPPALAINGPGVTYNPGQAPIRVAPLATLSTGNGEFANSSLSVIDPTIYANDRLRIGSSGPLVVSGQLLIYGGSAIGTFTGAGTRALAIQFNTKATQAAVLAVIQNITFNNVAARPATANRPIIFQLKTGSLGYSSAEVTQIVEIG